jgi:hypothetical protein
VEKFAVLRRFEGTPAALPVPAHGYLTAWNFWADGDAIDYRCPIAAHPGMKGRYPVNLARMRERSAGLGGVIGNIELGQPMHSLGRRYTSDPNEAFDEGKLLGLAHIARIKQDLAAMGTRLRGHYQMGLGRAGAGPGDLAAWAASGGAELIVLDLYGPVDLAWINKNGDRVRRARALADATGGRVGAFVTPGSLGDPERWKADLDAIARFAAWHGSALGPRLDKEGRPLGGPGRPLVDEWFFWADGARRDPQLRLYRLGYGVVEPCLEIFAGWGAPGA